MSKTIMRRLAYIGITLFIIFGNIAGAEISIMLLTFGAPMLIGLLTAYCIAKRKHSRHIDILRWLIIFYLCIPGLVMLILSILFKPGIVK